MESRGPGHCNACGADLSPADERCHNCGAARRPKSAERPASDALPRFLTNLYAAASIVLLVGQAQLAAYLLAPGGQPQLLATLRDAGITYPDPGSAILELTVLPPIGCALHIAAYFGLRARRAWGWALAMLAALIWCVFVVGLPVLFVLARRRVRRAFGVRF